MSFKGPEVDAEVKDVHKKNPEFAVHMLNEVGKAKANIIRGAFDDCLNTLAGVCTTGREFAVTKTKLEEACFFAKKAMAVNLSNQEYS
jgi:hypothetical protein